jgi:peroxiredoxin
MKLPALLAVALGLFQAAPPQLNASEMAKVDSPAPAFTLIDQNGTSHSLSDFKGKTVVLEWVNYECPFVRKHYDSGNMQRLQKEYTTRGVVWLSVSSSAPGKQGHYDADEIRKRLTTEKASPTAYLVDADGTVGKAYGAKTTPHMFVIDKEGVLAYMGAIDDIASTDVDDVAKAKNYVSASLEALMDGKKVAVKSSKPYGCSVKYR